MARPGWLAIRNLPFLESSKTVSNVYFRELKEFFKSHTTCPECEGKGYVLTSDDEQYIQKTEVSSIRFQGIKELEELSNDDDVVIGEVIRGILERELWGKESCTNCSGSRFVRRREKLKQAG